MANIEPVMGPRRAVPKRPTRFAFQLKSPNINGFGFYVGDAAVLGGPTRWAPLVYLYSSEPTAAEICSPAGVRPESQVLEPVCTYRQAFTSGLFQPYRISADGAEDWNSLRQHFLVYYVDYRLRADLDANPLGADFDVDAAQAVLNGNAHDIQQVGRFAHVVTGGSAPNT